MKIIEALNWAQEQLKATADEKQQSKLNPMLDAQILLSECLSKPTSYLFAHFDDELPAIAIDKFQRYVARRRRHEPVAYITGQKDFYGRRFRVNPAVLIPRPETEQIIDLALERLRDHSLVLDVGTGSGVIAVTLAAEQSAPVIAIDIAPDALAVARHNAASWQVEHQVSFLQGHLLEPFFDKNIHEQAGGHALVIANLPYGKINIWPTLDPDVREYEPKVAIIGGVDGLDLYDQLLGQLRERRDQFPRETELLFEIDPSQELSASNLVREHFPEAEVQVLPDLAQKPRIVIASI